MSVHLARGARDFLPDDAARRLWVVDRFKEIFARHGFDPLITPAFERIETLLGKYGDEGQKLIFKILKRGAGAERGECDLALRYDLTVPLARVVAMNPSLRLPFKRWQVAPVWRAERPAKGRYREFWQCDADIVGSTEDLADAQCIAVAHDALLAAGLTDFTVRLNHRRLLSALARSAGADADAETRLLVAVDKLDKIGQDGVDAELVTRGFDEAARAAVWQVLDLEGTDDEVLDGMVALLPGDEVAAAASTLRRVVSLAVDLGVAPERLRVDPTLARGLDYYTGPVFEVEADGLALGSIAAGGRYDGLIGVFGKQAVPAVGVALGLDRVLLALAATDALGPRHDAPQVLVTVHDGLAGPAAACAARLRREGIRTDLHCGGGSLKTQLKSANARHVPWVVIIGPREVEAGEVALKDMTTGDQRMLSVDDLAAAIHASAGG